MPCLVKAIEGDGNLEIISQVPVGDASAHTFYRYVRRVRAGPMTFDQRL